MTRILKAMFLVAPGVVSCGSSHLRSKTEPLSLGVLSFLPSLLEPGLVALGGCACSFLTGSHHPLGEPKSPEN